MGGSKGGGSFDTSGMEKAAKESNAIQKRIYDESIERGMPFYEAGREGLGTLMDYMGIAGGNSQKSEAQLREELSPRFTTMETMGGNPFAGRQWSSLTEDERNSLPENTMYIDNNGDLTSNYYTDGQRRSNTIFGAPAQSTKSVDYDGLNKAVEERLRAQEMDKPDYYGSLMKSFSQDDFEQDPGYQFRLDEGQKALERRLSAQGKTFSPEAAKAMVGYNQGMASQEYGNAYNRFNIDQGNVFNRLASIAGIGQTQTGQMAGLGQNYASAVGQTNSSLANAQASAAQAEAANRGSMFNSLLGLGGQLGAAYLTGGIA